MDFTRACGTLAHPTSFPTAFGIGDLGPSARDFIQFLVETDQTLWQILPLSPTGYGNSPYASYSAFAGNHFLISPEVLFEKQLITEEEMTNARLPEGIRVYYEESFARKRVLLETAFKRFQDRKNPDEQQRFKAFQKDNKFWLADYALFMACFEEAKLSPWNQWEPGLAKREKKALTAAKKRLKKVIDLHTWMQFEFSEQWMALREFAHMNGVSIIGDIPIFVDHNSADVWANPQFFAVDDHGNRTLVAGVPPDYFSETGQLWGNPLYKWKALENDGFTWWIQRFKNLLTHVDAIRLDHFRGFDAYWEVEADAKTAIHGRWVKGPGQKLFDAVKKELGDLPIIAEDLGVLTKSVNKLRDDNRFPGMKILQFAFADNAGNSFLPHNYTTPNCVVYSGTHDNDTTRGWYSTADAFEQHRTREYVHADGSQIHWDLIELGMKSIAMWSIFPLQDYMGLDGHHRMNLPGTVGENWLWRYTKSMMAEIDRYRIKNLIQVTNRNPKLANEDANLMEIHAEDE